LREQLYGVIIFVEPSCGDGRIIQQLSNSLQDISASDFFIFACDLDEAAVTKCRDNVSTLKPFLEGRIVVINGDYLQISKLHLLSHLHTEDLITGLIVVGNPPYSSGLGRGKAIDRDLPKRFIVHSIDIGAVFVSFVVPKRCQKEKESIRQLISQKSNESWDCYLIELDDTQFEFESYAFRQPSLIQCWHRI